MIKQILVLAIVGVVLIFGFAFATRSWLASDNTDSNAQQGTFPSATNIIPMPQKNVVTALADGSTITIPDYSQVPQPEWAGPWGYTVAGDVDQPYFVTYTPAGYDGVPYALFTIVLFSEPFEATQQSAEAVLLRATGMSRKQLCSSEAIVIIAQDADSSRAGELLPLTGCTQP